MRLIGVIDLLARRAVHARAGMRESYEPVRTAAGSSTEPGDALALAGRYVDGLGIRELYVADLDAILGACLSNPEHAPSRPASPAETPMIWKHARGSAPTRSPFRHYSDGLLGPDRESQDELVAAVAALGAPLWLDTAVSSADRARYAIDLGAARVVVGLETLSSYDALGDICNTVGGDRVAFSLDLRNGDPVVATGGIPPGEPAQVVARHAAEVGAGAVIVIDLARVGTGSGLDLGLIGRVREAAPMLTLLAGGGIRGRDDLVRLADSGCDGALVATALHDGRLSAADVAAVQRLGP